MGCILFIELVQSKNPLIVVESTEDVKMIELHCLTYNENDIPETAGENSDQLVKSPECQTEPKI